MDKQKNRKYVSPAREKQAADTRNRVLDAAEALLLEKGFAGTTVADVARRAGVSPQTIYATFSSKAGIIMAAIEDRVLRDERNVDAIKQLHSTTDPVLILRSAARIIRNIYEGNAPTFTAVYGAGLVSPQLAELEKELNDLRREKQAPVVETLIASGQLLPIWTRTPCATCSGCSPAARSITFWSSGAAGPRTATKPARIPAHYKPRPSGRHKAPSGRGALTPSR